jgi:hypothetical protein
MEQITSDSPVASTETGATPPSEASTTSTSEAVQGATPESVATPIQSGETVAANQDDFPDEQAFLQLQGAERGDNWKRARARIGELNQRVEQLSGLETFKPVSESIEQMGGWERVEPLLQLANGLFTPQVDPYTNQPVIDPQTELPQYTAAPFVEALAEQSVNTLGEIIWRGLDQPIDDNDTLAHWILRERFGLDPNLLSTYQSIQSPNQAREYISRSGGIDPAELEGIDPPYHDAYKSLTPHLRDEFALMGDEAKAQILEERKELLETRKFREEQKAALERQNQERQAQWENRIRQAGEQTKAEVRSRILNARREVLKADASFFPEEADNAVIWDEILNYGESQLGVAHPADLQRCNQLYDLEAYHNATGDTWKAKQARVEADRLATKLDGRLRNFVTERTKWWSTKLGSARSAQQQQIKDAQPRIEIGAGGSHSSQPSQPNLEQPQNGQRFGLSPSRINQLAAQLALKKAGQG